MLDFSGFVDIIGVNPVGIGFGAVASPSYPVQDIVASLSDAFTWFCVVNYPWLCSAVGVLFVI